MGSNKQETTAMNMAVPSSAAAGRRKAASGKRKRTICFVVGAVVVLLALILLILGLTVFKAKKPVTTVDSVTLSNFDLSFNALPLAIHLNLTLDARVSVWNPNRVGFRYDNSSVLLKYRGENVGDAPIPAGKIAARETVPMNVTLTLMADRLLSDNKLYSDVTAGTVAVTTYTAVTGTVKILFNIRVKSVSTCDVVIDVATRRVANQTCHYKTKL